MPADHEPARPALSRRALLRQGSYAVAAAVVAGPLAGCGIRVEPDSANLPFVPSREPGPGEAVLLTAWAGSLALRDAALAVGGAATSLPAVLAGLHSDQGQVLADSLDRLGVPQDAQFAARTAVLTRGTAPTTGPSAESLGAEEAAAVTADRLTDAVTVPAELYPAVSTLLAQRAAAATLLGAAVTWPEVEWASAEAAQPLLDAARSAAYGFEVVVAQGADRREELAQTTLSALRTRVRILGEVMGDAAQPPVAGYVLPFEVSTPVAAARLGTQVLTRLRTSVAAVLPDLRTQPEAQSDTVATLAEAEVLAHRWGLDLVPFPGLS